MLTWLGFAGAWLLVAGPIFQAMVELHEYDAVKVRFGESARGIPRPPAVSAWWWLLPPVRFYLSRRRSQRFFEQVFAKLDPGDLREYAVLFDKAIGWALVAGGGILLAAKETLAAADGLGLGRLPGIAATVVLLSACSAGARYRLAHSREFAQGRQPK